MPVLHLGGDGNDRTGMHLHGLLAFLHIPAVAGHADKHLHRAVVDVPIVAAARLESHIDRTAILVVKTSHITLAHKILSITRVGHSFGPYIEIDIHYLCFYIHPHSHQQGRQEYCYSTLFHVFISLNSTLYNDYKEHFSNLQNYTKPCNHPLHFLR